MTHFSEHGCRTGSGDNLEGRRQRSAAGPIAYALSGPSPDDGAKPLDDFDQAETYLQIPWPHSDQDTKRIFRQYETDREEYNSNLTTAYVNWPKLHRHSIQFHTSFSEPLIQRSYITVHHRSDPCFMCDCVPHIKTYAYVAKERRLSYID